MVLLAKYKRAKVMLVQLCDDKEDLMSQAVEFANREAEHIERRVALRNQNEIMRGLMIELMN